MALHGQSLNAATTTGPGTAIHFDVPNFWHSMWIQTTGSPDTAAVVVEGTLNGTDWFFLFQVTAPATIAGTGSVFPVIAIRANLITLAGGTSPTVTVWLAAA